MRKQQSRRAFVATTGSVLTVGLAGCTSDSEGDSAEGSKDETSSRESSTSTETTKQTTTQKPSKALEIVDHEAYEGDYDSGVKGTVKNNSDEELDYVEVKAKFMDSEGTLLESGIDDVSGLSGGQKWDFKIMYLGDEEFKDYELEVSTGF